MLPAPLRYASWLAIFRLYTGIFWLLHGVPKLLNPKFFGPDGMAGMIQQTASGTPPGPYQSFLLHTVLPNAWLFSHLVAWGETLTGVSLLLGLLTPLGGIVGTFLALNYFMMKGSYAHLTDFAGLDFETAVLSFIHVVLPTGLVAGIDGALWASRSRRATAGKT